MKTEKPYLYHYSSYRKFLADFYQWNKRHDPSFSLRYFASQAGLKSYNYLKLIIDGERRMTETFLEPFCRVLKLDAPEKGYFRVLVKFTDAKDATEKTQYFAEMMTLRERSERHVYDVAKVGLYDQWYYVPLIELTETKGFVSQPSWIASRLGISVADARRAIAQLIRSGVLQERCGTLMKTHILGDATDEIRDFTIQRYHHENLKIAATEIFEQPLTEREYGSVTFSVTPEKLGKLKARMKAFRQEVFTILDEPDGQGESVYQLGFQLFRLTKKGVETC